MTSTLKSTLIAGALIAGFTATASAEGFGKPCTSEPKEKWMTLEAIEKIVKEHGYQVAKSKMKDSCAEIYVRDADGKRQELFIDPATGKPAGSDWKAPAKKEGAS